MSNVNIGVLLDELNISTADDYFNLDVNDRKNCLARIQSSARQSTKGVLTEMEHTPGLKMHFRAKPLRQGGWQNIPNDTFARKMAFFASKSVVTVPLNQVAYWEKEIRCLFELLCAVRPFLREGFVSILPSTQTLEKELRKKKYGLVSANFSLDNLETQFEERVYPTVIANLFLPYFRDIDPEDVIRIRREEDLLYTAFESKLSRLLNAGKAPDREETLLKELEEIDQHIRQLTVKYEAIQDAYKKNNIYLLIGLAAVGLVALFPPLPVLTSAFIDSGVSALQYLKLRMNRASEAKAERKEEYYLLWRLSDSRRAKSRPWRRS
jgi:hypothetical protein